ncbi:MAG: hypothetical protein M1499_04280 [Firmicutes bacterium]|nr:hypothetical protein [Bacillota bacterium]
MELRDQRSGPHQAPYTSASDSSKTAILDTLKQRVQRLEQENRALRHQIEVLYGQLSQRGTHEDRRNSER